MTNNRLVAATIIRNEANNYLREWLKNIGKIADYHIFLDDASDDDTPQIITQHLKSHMGELHQRRTSLFRENEPALRGELWEHVRRVSRDGDWILIVDADEFYDEHLTGIKQKLLDNKFPDAEVVKVSCLDMWNPYDYRIDGFWSPLGTDVRIIRYHDIPFGSTSTRLHMPPYPAQTNTEKNLDVFIPKIHVAYLRDSDKSRRYEFYTQNVSPVADNLSYRHAMSIMDKNVKLKTYFDFWSNLWAIFHGRRLYYQIYHTLKKSGDKK